MYVGQQVKNHRDASLKQMIEKNRVNNFTFKDSSISSADPSLKTSVAHSHFDYKGNAMEIRPQLDPEVRKDLV